MNPIKDWTNIPAMSVTCRCEGMEWIGGGFLVPQSMADDISEAIKYPGQNRAWGHDVFRIQKAKTSQHLEYAFLKEERYQSKVRKFMKQMEGRM